MDFYKQNGSYFTTAGQKILNPTELQGYAKAGGKEVSTPVVPQGATKIADPSGLKGLTESQIFRQGQDIYKLPEVDKTVNPMVAKPEVPVVEPQANTAPFMAILDTTNKGVEKAIKQSLTPPKEQAEAAETENKIMELEEQKTAKPQDFQTEQEKYGFTPNVKALQDLNSQIASVQAQYNQLVEQNKNLPISSRIIGGTADRLQRQAAIELGGLSSMAQALQGNIKMAQDIAKQTVDMKYEAIQSQIDAQKFQLDSVYDRLDDSEKRQADALNIALAERQRLLEDEKLQDQGIYDIMLIASQNGADNNTLQKIMKSSSPRQAILNAGSFMAIADTSKPEKIGIDANGNDLYYNPNTGTVQTADQLTINQLGIQVGTIKGLPAYDTFSANPGMARSDRNNNPGNIKVSDYTKEFEGVVGVESKPSEDGGNFLIFENPQAGLDAIGRLLLEGKSYQGVNAETAIKRYNNNGTYGASNVGLDPNKDFQSQIKDPAKRREVAKAIAMAEGWSGGANIQTQLPEEVIGLTELVRTGQLTPKEALSQVSKNNQSVLAAELPKIEAQKVVSSYTEEMKNRTLQSVDELLGQVNQYTVGFGSLMKGVPTSPARSFSAQLDTLKANIAFGELTAMREASKTGGALGQVSDREGKLLQSTLGALDQGQSPEQFKAQLEKIKNSIITWKQEINNYSSEAGISSVDLSDLNFVL